METDVERRDRRRANYNKVLIVSSSVLLLAVIYLCIFFPMFYAKTDYIPGLAVIYGLECALIGSISVNLLAIWYIYKEDLELYERDRLIALRRFNCIITNPLVRGSFLFILLISLYGVYLFAGTQEKWTTTPENHLCQQAKNSSLCVSSQL
jgi:hypothetical protein